MVQLPDEGNPLNATDPVGTAHVGWVMTPTNGAVGTAGAALITALSEAVEVQPDALVTLNV